MDSTVEISSLLSAMGHGGGTKLAADATASSRPARPATDAAVGGSAPATVAAKAASDVQAVARIAGSYDSVVGLMQQRELSVHAAQPVHLAQPVHAAQPVHVAQPGQPVGSTHRRSGSDFGPSAAMRSATTDVTEPLREAEERFRQALHSASLSSTASYAPQKEATPNMPPPPIVQMLIDKLGAVILPKE
jgi:hypothetical protein